MIILCQPYEELLHRVDPGKVAAQVMPGAALALGHPEIALRIGVPGARAAEVDDSGQVLLSLQCSGRKLVTPEGLRDAAVQ